MARRVGLLFKSLGLLTSSDVVSCSATDFVTGYANQSGGKTREMFDKALGQVLFIDEAYRCVAAEPGVGACALAVAIRARHLTGTCGVSYIQA